MKLIIKAKTKEIDLLINIINRLHNSREEWTSFDIAGTLIMIPGEYFENINIEKIAE